MNATQRKSLARQIQSTLTRVMALPKAALFHLLNGAAIQRLLGSGDLIRTGDYLIQMGGGDLRDGYQSWYGRAVVKAYRQANHREPLRAWVQHRTTGRWIHVYVYCPGDPALLAGLASYSRTAHLVPAGATFAEAA
jgi:hypothetical protein